MYRCLPTCVCRGTMCLPAAKVPFSEVTPVWVKLTCCVHHIVRAGAKEARKAHQSSQLPDRGTRK